MHVCACVPDACGGQKKAWDPLELELQMVVRHLVGARTQTQGLCRSDKCSHLLRSRQPLCCTSQMLELEVCATRSGFLVFVSIIRFKKRYISIN